MSEKVVIMKTTIENVFVAMDEDDFSVTFDEITEDASSYWFLRDGCRIGRRPKESIENIAEFSNLIVQTSVKEQLEITRTKERFKD